MALINQGGKLLLRDGKLASGQGCCCAPAECTVGIKIKAPPYWVDILGRTDTKTLLARFNCNLRPVIFFSAAVIQLPRQGYVSIYYDSDKWFCAVGVDYLGCPYPWSSSGVVYTSGHLSVAADGLPSAQSLDLSDFTISQDGRSSSCPCYENYQVASYNVCENNFPSLLEIVR